MNSSTRSRRSIGGERNDGGLIEGAIAATTVLEATTLLDAVTALRRTGILTDAEYRAKRRRLAGLC